MNGAWGAPMAWVRAARVEGRREGWIIAKAEAEDHWGPAFSATLARQAIERFPDEAPSVSGNPGSASDELRELSGSRPRVVFTHPTVDPCQCERCRTDRGENIVGLQDRVEMALTYLDAANSGDPEDFPAHAIILCVHAILTGAATWPKERP